MDNFKRKYQKHLCQLADLSNEFKSVILETDQRKMLPFMRLLWEKQRKYLQSSQNNASIQPMNPDADVTYQTVNLFSSDKCFISFISDVPHTFNEISTALPIQFWKR